MSEVEFEYCGWDRWLIGDIYNSQGNAEWSYTHCDACGESIKPNYLFMHVEKWGEEILLCRACQREREWLWTPSGRYATAARRSLRANV